MKKLGGARFRVPPFFLVTGAPVSGAAGNQQPLNPVQVFFDHLDLLGNALLAVDFRRAFETIGGFPEQGALGISLGHGEQRRQSLGQKNPDRDEQNRRETEDMDVVDGGRFFIVHGINKF